MGSDAQCIKERIFEEISCLYFKTHGLIRRHHEQKKLTQTNTAGGITSGLSLHGAAEGGTQKLTWEAGNQFIQNLKELFRNPTKHRSCNMAPWVPKLTYVTLQDSNLAQMDISLKTNNVQVRLL
jgi:hypothetical protein